MRPNLLLKQFITEKKYITAISESTIEYYEKTYKRFMKITSGEYIAPTKALIDQPSINSRAAAAGLLSKRLPKTDFMIPEQRREKTCTRTPGLK